MNTPESRKRGRPATGNAMSNAERQRAYRERQAKKRNAEAVTLNERAQQTLESSEQLRAQRDLALLVQAQAEQKAREWEAKAKSLLKQLRELEQRKDAPLAWYQDPGLEAVYVLESRLREEKNWKRVASMGAFTRKEVADEWLKSMVAHSSMIEYRVNRIRFKTE
ncbi:hypothetical protein PSm6_51520 [Pseudomonas solani]|uniref:Uncharacterized protein n=1 Tax=Pseudomonas solani TaxID=2731552 RepID=A0ABM7LGK3_9PSED|nr:hypothetical protein [Pseudomonas solani]EQM66732.1 hypothetical protein L682_03930 [Pseudomonas alcaligenes OT 69]MDN4145719.1 hypothetical protein [Pseudomonas tohonis]BCD88745.1 hypothetical protein PSm6_51520 [Pseudomonas solani]